MNKKWVDYQKALKTVEYFNKEKQIKQNKRRLKNIVTEGTLTEKYEGGLWMNKIKLSSLIEILNTSKDEDWIKNIYSTEISQLKLEILKIRKNIFNHNSKSVLKEKK